MARKQAQRLASEPAIPDSVKLSTRIPGSLEVKLGVLSATTRTTKAKIIVAALEAYIDARLSRMPSLAIGPGNRADRADDAA